MSTESLCTIRNGFVTRNRIAFDATALLGPMSKGRGIACAIQELIYALLTSHPNQNFYVFNTWERVDWNDYFPGCKNLKETYLYSGKDGFLMTNPDYKDVYGNLVQAFLKEQQIDAFFITSPFEDQIHTYEKEWFRDVRTAAMVYDLIPWVFPERYLPSKQSKVWYRERVNAFTWMDMLFLNSKSVEQDLAHFFNITSAKHKMSILGTAPGKKFQNLQINEEKKQDIFGRLGVREGFLLCVAGDDERKNIAGLVEAYAMLSPELRSKHQLVVACKLSEGSFNRYVQVARNHAAQNDVVFTNYIEENDLIALYNLTNLAVFPSLYEGFGLPVVEAWACGAPVLTSNNSSLGEVAGDAAITVDPFDVNSIKDGLKLALSETDLVALAKRGQERLRLYSIEEQAEQFLHEMEALCVKPCEQTSRFKVAFFTPLPPALSGVADYSVDLLSKLIDYFDIDVIVDDGYTPTPLVDPRIRIRSLKQFEAAPRYDEYIYQMGNNADFHVYMKPYIEKYPGVVVMHEINLHGMAKHLSLYSGNTNFELYRKILMQDYPTEIADRYVEDAKQLNKLPLNDIEVNHYFIQGATRFIVHSDYVKRRMLQKDISRDVKRIAHYTTLTDTCLFDWEVRQKLSVKESDVLFGVFGIMAETKRNAQIISAFQRLFRKHKNIHLLFCGPTEYSPIKQEDIDRLGLADAVTLLGKVQLDYFERCINACDVCLNLRYPYNGESSGTVARIMSKEKPVIVNRIGSFGEFPEDTCLFLPDVAELSEKEEVTYICGAMERLLNPQLRAKIGAAARAYCERETDLNLVAECQKNFILSRNRSALTEGLLAQIQPKIQEQNYSKAEKTDLIHTLGYSKLLF